MHDGAWVMVAESSRARLFRRRGAGLEELEDFAHPASRAHARDIVTDKPGRGFASGGARHAMDPAHDPHQIEAQTFARQIIERLEAGRVGAEFERLVLIAPPQFLGHLRHAMPEALVATITATVDKNLVHAGAREILACLEPS